MTRIRAILVHGTFSKNAKWDHPDGPFAQELRRLTQERGQQLDVEEFTWSGDNSHQARRAAADDLAKLVQERLAEDDAKLYLIGHSHGGTVIRLALNSAPPGPRPHGVFTFGAPFVRFRPRRVAEASMVGMWVARALMAVLVLLGVDFLISQRVFSGDAATNAAAAAVLSAGALWLFVWRIPASLFRNIRQALLETRDEILAKYDPPETTITRYVCFHAPFDEASIFLRFWSVLTWLLQSFLFALVYAAFLFVITATLSVGYRLLENAGVISASLTSAIFAPFMEFMRGAFDWMGGANAEFAALYAPSASTLAAFLVMLAVAGGAILVAPICAFLPWALRSQWFVFGGERFLWNFAAEIHTDRLPNAHSELRVRFMPQAFANGKMQHSYYFYDPGVVAEVAEQMCDWTPPEASARFPVERFLARSARLVFLLIAFAGFIGLTWMIAEYFAAADAQAFVGPR